MFTHTSTFSKSATTLGLVEQAFWRTDLVFTLQRCTAENHFEKNVFVGA